MYYINFSLLFQAVDRVTSSQSIQNNIVDTICLYLVMESKMNNMLHIIFTLHPVDYLSLHPNHGFKRQGLFHIHRLSPLRFRGPVGAMYQSVGKCFRMHLRATSIHKIPGGLGGPLTPRQFYGARLAPQPIR